MSSNNYAVEIKDKQALRKALMQLRKATRFRALACSGPPGSDGFPDLLDIEGCGCEILPQGVWEEPEPVPLDFGNGYLGVYLPSRECCCIPSRETEQSASTATDYIDRLHKSVGANRDTEGLGTMPAGPFIVGSVDAINGEDGKEVPEFVGTRHELKQLAGYWMGERIERDFDWFVFQSTGSSEWRWSEYISRRLDRLAEVLGPEAMRAVHGDAVAAFRKHHPKITDEDWHVFTAGSEEEQEAWRDKVFRKEETAEGPEQ
jgi:hypothetical protein